MTADRTLNSHAAILAPTAMSVPPSGPTPLRLTPCAPPYVPTPSQTVQLLRAAGLR